MNGKLILVLFAALVAVASASRLGSYERQHGIGSQRRNNGVSRIHGQGIVGGNRHIQGGQRHYQPTSYPHRYRRSASGLNYGSRRGSIYSGQNHGVSRIHGQGIVGSNRHIQGGQRYYQPTSYPHRYRRSASGLNYGSRRGSIYSGQNHGVSRIHGQGIVGGNRHIQGGQRHYQPTSYPHRYRRSASGLNYGSHRGSIYSGQNHGVSRIHGQGIVGGNRHIQGGQRHYQPTSYPHRYRRSASGLNYDSRRGSIYSGQDHYNPGVYQNSRVQRPSHSNQGYNRQYYQH